MDDTTSDEATAPGRRGMTLFRGQDACSLIESGAMSTPAFDPEDRQALDASGPRSPNLDVGGHVGLLFRGLGEDGYSLVKVSFAPHYILPRHTHDADCLYYVAEGSITMGAQTLVAGDGFFVPSDAPYAYEAGPDGVVVLEFRTRTSFDTNISGNKVERYARRNALADEHAEKWDAWRAATVG